MEGRERLSRIKSNYTVLTFSFIEMFAKDLVGYRLGRGNRGIARQVCFMCMPACVRALVVVVGGGTRVVTQLKIATVTSI